MAAKPATPRGTEGGGPKIEINLQNFGGNSGVDTQLAVNNMLNFHDSGNAVSVSGIQGALGALIYRFVTPGWAQGPGDPGGPGT